MPRAFRASLIRSPTVFMEVSITENHYGMPLTAIYGIP